MTAEPDAAQLIGYRMLPRENPAIDLAPWRQTVVRPTVVDVYRRWQDYVDLDDLMQEAAVWWYGPGQQYLEQYLTEDDKFVRLRRSIWRWCARYAEVEKAHARGYEAIDQYPYSPLEVIGLIPFCLGTDLPTGAGEPDGGPTAKGNLAESGDLLASWIDVRRALAALPEDDLHFLYIADDWSYDWDRVATYTGTLADSCRRRHARIAERMARWLSGHREELAA